MLDRLPDQIEPLALADAGRSFRGKLAVAALPRLHDVLADVTGEIAVELVLKVDSCRVRVLLGKLNGQLVMTCQRCLGEMHLPLDLQFQLAIVGSETQAQALPEGYEVLLADGDPMLLSSIIEDEIILALPIIPKHDDEARCGDIANKHKPEPQKANPFAVLKQLNTK